MYLFDTDILTYFRDESPAYAKLRERILAVDPAQRYISVINVEEALQGQWTEINRQRGKVSEAKLGELYALYQRTFAFLGQFHVVSYNAAAAVAFERVERKVRAQHSMDARIAACAVAHGLVVLTSNQEHFRKIGIARFEDWTREAPKD